MEKARTIPMMLLFVLMLGFLFSLSTSYATDSESSSDEDRHKEVSVTASVNVNVGTSGGTAHVRSVPAPPPKLPDPTKIFKIIKEILCHEITELCHLSDNENFLLSDKRPPSFSVKVEC